MTISNLHLDPHESQVVRDLAIENLMRHGLSYFHALQARESLSPPNLLRLALNLPIKHPGGVRPGGFEPGNQHSPKSTRRKNGGME